MKTYKNYLKNQAKRRDNPLIRQIRSGVVVKRRESLEKPTVHSVLELTKPLSTIESAEVATNET